VVLITLDNHLSRVATRARETLAREIPKLTLSLHAATDWENDPGALARCNEAIAKADIVIATMLFMEDHIRAVLPALEARREACDAMVIAMSAGEAIRLTKLGRFRMDAPQRGPLALLKKLRGKREGQASSGAGQMAMLRRLPKLLRFIPGKAQDVRAYFLTLQYWLSGSEANMANMVRFLIDRYAAGPRASLRGALKTPEPQNYPDVGVYHPNLKGRMAETAQALPAIRNAKGAVGVLVMRSYVLAGDTAHYDAVIAALEAKGLRAIPVFASGLDSRPAIEKFLMKDGKRTVDAIVSLTGFSLVGGPAYNDAQAAQEFLAKLDIPYVAAQPVEFQTLDRWSQSSLGLTPVESTIMVAIPELDGATAPIVFGGRSEAQGEASRMHPALERVDTLAARVARLVELRATAKAKRRVAVVLFNFPPNAGAAGSAAYLSVFASLFNTLKAMKADGYDVEVPASVDALRTRLLNGNAQNFGTDANVAARVAVDDHVRREPHLNEIESQWGPAPGKQLTDGRSLLVLGERFGNVFVGLQPGFGYEGDPMRLLFEKGFAPTHAFSAFYRYLREDFAAHAVLHFGTHGALEFMPGKQVGLSGECWPERLIRDLPNFYLYASNNPSEGAIAKRRSAATLISYLTPQVVQAGLYKGLSDLKASLEHWRMTEPGDTAKREDLRDLIADQASAVDLSFDHPEDLAAKLYEYEQTLIPEGFHIVGEAMSAPGRVETLTAMADAHGAKLSRATIDAIVGGASPAKALALSGLKATDGAALIDALCVANLELSRDAELPAILHALDGGFIRPAPGGDVLRNPAVLPTGRNVHGFDPFRIPSAFALKSGAAQAQRLLDRHGTLPESVAMVLWGTDNLKSEGGPIAQVLALIGAKPRFDSYGRLCGASLIPLEELGRPRIDVIITLSGIFRDLLPLQIRMLAEAALLAAEADEPLQLNFIRKHALAHQAALNCDLETAALRIFSNAEGVYGANVNHMIDASCWNDGSELADAFEARKSFAYGRRGLPVRRPELMNAALKSVNLAYQNIESLELGVTTVDHYVDMLGGVTSAVRRAKGESVNVYVGDETQGQGKVRSLSEQVALETRTRTLNPRWYEGLLQHGHEGVRQIESQVTNTMGWSATAGQVDPWIYEKITATYVLDDEMRNRIARLNPKASMRLANRLLEAHDRKYWTPDAATLEALKKAGDELEDRLEGIGLAAAE
jgi:magnesium chelatase subunit H